MRLDTVWKDAVFMILESIAVYTFYHIMFEGIFYLTFNQDSIIKN